MSVSELIAKLKDFDGSRLVVMAKDAEGNNYSPLSDFSTGAYAAKSTRRCEVGLEALTDAARANGYSEEDVVDGVAALVLWPVN